MATAFNPANRRHEVSEDFTKVPATAASAGYSKNENFMISGFSGVDANASLVAEGVQIATFSGVAGDSGFSGANTVLRAHSTAGLSTINTSGYLDTSKEPAFTLLFKTGAAITSEIIWAGLKMTGTPTQATDDNSCYFLYSAGVNNNCWQVCISRSGTDTVYSTDIAVTANTWYELEIDINESREVFCRINGRPTSISPYAALTASVALYPFVGVQDESGFPRAIKVNRIDVGRSL